MVECLISLRVRVLLLLLTLNCAQEFGKPRTNPQLLLDLLVNKINHTEMQMVAVFDVLTSQCDRHQQNLFLTETGKVWAIDNDQVRARLCDWVHVS